MSVRWSTEASSRGRASSKLREEKGWNWYEYLNAEGFEKTLLGRCPLPPLLGLPIARKSLERRMVATRTSKKKKKKKKPTEKKKEVENLARAGVKT